MAKGHNLIERLKDLESRALPGGIQHLDQKLPLDLDGWDLRNIGTVEAESAVHEKTTTGTLKVTDSATGTGTPDTIVESTSDLESAFNNLSAGEYVYVKTPGTPYRTSQWLDVEASNVRIEAETPYADDGQAIVKPADGADVGGIRVGTGATTRTNINIINFGFDGNQATMTGTVKRLHGIIVDNATDVTIEGGFHTQTHPYHEHNTGGSGVSVHHQASDVKIRDVTTDDIGDRGIQVAGTNITITGCHLRNGFDRSIAMELLEPDGVGYRASKVDVHGNICRDNSAGSCIGATGGQTENLSIVGNVCLGMFRGGVRLGNTKNSQVKDNLIYHTDGDGRDAGVKVEQGATVAIVGNTILETNNGTAFNRCIYVKANARVADNYLNCQGIEGITIDGSNVQAQDNTIHHFGSGGTGAGIDITANGGNATVYGNWGRTSNNAAAWINSDTTGAVYLGDNIRAGGTAPASDYSLSAEPYIAEGNWPAYYSLDTVATFAGGGTQSFTIPGASLGDDPDVKAVPNADPGNDLGFTVDKVWYDTSAGAMKMQVSETEAAGGGDARVRGAVTKAA